MQSAKRLVLSAVAAASGVLLAGSSTWAQTTQPVAKDDTALGLSVSNRFQTLKHVKGNGSVKDAGTVTGTSWGQSFIQSVEFDNLNGFRHNAQGNLLGLNFGTATGGGQLYAFQTNGIVAGQTAPAASKLLLNFNGQNGTELGRIGGLSVSPQNTRVAVSSNDVGPTATKAGKLIVLDYDAAGGNTADVAVSNYRSIEVPGLRTGSSSRTSNTTWLDSNNILVAAGSADLTTAGNLFKVTVAADGSLSQTQVATDLFGGFNLSFTNVNYEPTVSPYVYVSGSGFIASTTVNKLIVVDPRNNFAPVTSLLDFSPGGTSGAADGIINTLREAAFDSKGNLLFSAYAGSDAASADYVLKSLKGAYVPATLSDTDPDLVGFLQKQQTGDPVNSTTGNIGVQSNFSGMDVALSNIDFVNIEVGVNIGSGDYVQQYLTGDPKAQLLAKLRAGTIVGAGAVGTGVGYKVTPASADEGTFRLIYTYLGDADLNRTVNFADLVALAQNYNGTGRVWTEGDFNYDTNVNFADLVLLAQNYNKTLTPAQIVEAGFSADFAADYARALALVPEPASLMAAGALAIAARRRRTV